MSGLFCCHLRLEEASSKSEGADQVKKLMSCALVIKTKMQVAEIAILTHLQSRNVKESAHVLYLLLCHRMLDNDDCVVDVSSLYKAMVEKEFYLMEEHESPACSDLFRIKPVLIPLRMLHSKNFRIEVQHDII